MQKLRLRACKLVESLRHGRVRGPQRPDLVEDQAVPRRVPRTFLRQACWSDLHVYHFLTASVIMLNSNFRSHDPRRTRDSRLIASHHINKPLQIVKDTIIHIDR